MNAFMNMKVIFITILFDPNTLMPPNYMKSVNRYYNDSALGDALSTTLF